MDHQFGTFDMAQELMSESDTFRCTFDQSRNISDYESVRIRKIHDTKVWIQCCEMIIGDLRLCIRHT